MSLSAIARRLAPAKINLFLHVGGKRPDLYHELLSLAVFAEIGDWLTAGPAQTLSLDVTGPFAKGLDGGADAETGQQSKQLDHDRFHRNGMFVTNM